MQQPLPYQVELPVICLSIVWTKTTWTPRRTVLISTTMMECEDILILKEMKLVTITENVKTPTSFMYLSRNQRVQLCNFFLSFPPFPTNIDMFPIPFAQTFEFISPISILELAIVPTFEQFSSPPILTKHPVWYSLDADFFIALQGTLYGLHWQHFQNSILFQEIVTHGEKNLISLLPQHSIPFDILKSNLFDHFLVLPYHGSFKLNHLTRDD